MHRGLFHLLHRAGGGHHFGGGGGGGSSSGGHISGFHSTGTTSGSSGGGGIIGLIILVVIVIVIVLIIRAARKNKVGTKPGAPATGVAPPMPPAPAGAPAAAPVSNLQAGLEAIRAHDPAFDPATFISDAERAFFTVQEAWTELKPEMSRRVMADNIWQQHRVQIENYRTSNRRNVLEDLSVASANIVSAHSDTAFDTITLRFLAGCADYDIDTSNDKHKVVRGNHDFTQWTEDWTFQRSAEATTKTGGGTMASKCPNCGAPLDLDLAGVCKYCRAPVMSGKYDWVLMKIDQVLNGSSGGGYSY
jgi:predicted lipid-binding transport protein (Tim44 family)